MGERGDRPGGFAGEPDQDLGLVRERRLPGVRDQDEAGATGARRADETGGAGGGALRLAA
ncbi:hypothetical protein ABZ297_26865 [Nonomuraea sp. NPDC005983]|uniref:hypothetical protein n=1 Tax=Nonomuraea sp. NPDC005983 TaxID=3155595 RepID=UPI0033ABCDD9